MTENEAIKRIKEQACNDRFLAIHCDDSCLYGAEKCEWAHAIQVLEEIQQYRAIGTVEDINKAINLGLKAQVELKDYKSIGTIEEFKALKEKSVAKKPRWHGHHFCPHCNSIVYVNGGKNRYCTSCGQKLDWSE